MNNEVLSECKEINNLGILDPKIINIQVRRDFKVKRNLIIIENTYKEQNINIDKIFEKGYSTKNADKDSHGLGLWNIRRILQKNNNLQNSMQIRLMRKFLCGADTCIHPVLPA